MFGLCASSHTHPSRFTPSENLTHTCGIPYHTPMGVTQQQMLFVEAYDGTNAVEAMRIAGCEGHPQFLLQEARKLLSMPQITNAIINRDKLRQTKQTLVANRKERQEFWTSLIRNKDPHHIPVVDGNGNEVPQENIPISQRLKASELLGRSEVDFVERVDVNQNITITDLVKQSYLDDTPVKELEADYKVITEQDKLPTPTEPQTPAEPAPPSSEDYL